MLGPVSIMNICWSGLKMTSLGIKLTPDCNSIHGCLADSKIRIFSSLFNSLGLQYGIGAVTEVTAKLVNTSSCAMTSFSMIRGDLITR